MCVWSQACVVSAVGRSPCCVPECPLCFASREPRQAATSYPPTSMFRGERVNIGETASNPHGGQNPLAHRHANARRFPPGRVIELMISGGIWPNETSAPARLVGTLGVVSPLHRTGQVQVPGRGSGFRCSRARHRPGNHGSNKLDMRTRQGFFVEDPVVRGWFGVPPPPLLPPLGSCSFDLDLSSGPEPGLLTGLPEESFQQKWSSPKFFTPHSYTFAIEGYPHVSMLFAKASLALSKSTRVPPLANAISCSLQASVTHLSMSGTPVHPSVVVSKHGFFDT